MNWITRERPQIDRIACPWLIKRFIDKAAIFYFMPPEEVLSKAAELNAIPFDIPNVEFTHYEDRCTFDYFVKKYQIKDPAIRQIAKIVRAADTDRYEIAPQAMGLWAITAGLSHNIKDDLKLLEIGMTLYDGLYSWAKHLKNQKHTEQPSEALLLEIHRKFLKQRSNTKKAPDWVKELRAIIQDQIDTDLSLRLKEISQILKIHPAYLSREFSKYFDGMSFGEYIRKLRIERAIDLISTEKYSLSEIAYLTGFSDQSHFTRIFKKNIGISPGAYKKQRKGTSNK